MTEDLAWGVYNFINEWKAGNFGEISLQDALENDFNESDYVSLKKPMKFFISRTSRSYESTPPIENTIKLNPNKKEWEDFKWGIEIGSLEELISLKEKVRVPIILRNPYDDDCNYSKYELEIYDDYRE